MDLYDQLMSLQGVTEVELLDDCKGTIGVYVAGGSDEPIAKIIAENTFAWSSTLGDTEVVRNFYRVRFYRSKLAFRVKFKELFGKEFE